MIFQMKQVLVATALVLGLASVASADNHCVIGCGSSTPSGITLDVNGVAAIGGNVGSVFTGDTGENILNTFGDSDVDIESSLDGFCPDGTCGDTSVDMDLFARQGGGATTTVSSDDTTEGVSAQNTGVFNSQVLGSIEFGGNTGNLLQGSTQGASAFANQVGANTNAGNSSITFETYGSGETESLLGTDGDACATCVDFTGGTTATSNSGVDLTASAFGGHSGFVLNLGNTSISESAISSGTMSQ